jgi:dihydropteroate synthase
MINDINALNGDGSLEVAAATDVPVILMHCPADFAAMHLPTTYDHVALDVFDWLERRIEACGFAGLSRQRLIVDPGIGFVKQAPQSAAVLARVSLFHGLGCPVLIGASRKSFIGRLAGGDTADDRLPGSLAAALWASGQGAQILRVHDVAETRQAMALQMAIEARLADGSQPFHCTMAHLPD